MVLRKTRSEGIGAFSPHRRDSDKKKRTEQHLIRRKLRPLQADGDSFFWIPDSTVPPWGKRNEVREEVSKGICAVGARAQEHHHIFRIQH